MFYILDHDNARKKYKEKVSEDIALLKIMLENYSVDPDRSLINLKKSPSEVYKFINNFYKFNDGKEVTTMGLFFTKLTKYVGGNPYYTTSLGLSIIQDTLDLLYTNQNVNLNKYQFNSNDIGQEYDVFGASQAFIVGDGYKSPVVFNSEIVRKYKPLNLDIPMNIKTRPEDDLATLYSKLSVSDILVLFYNLTTKAPIIKVG